ncbi:SWIM zinc finger family protein [Roseateles terrae]|uniref:SWIM-type domain-containing protein n=1 Tax=Roseateles terrae TaxID=431060 RepID=A0ABR6GRJ0_9BURK|nr:SWIM zinc finger family protein [Roseateles terrae]MBB3194726.1 hypothetical protein [Roseateles terrae]OWQ85994.1 hypothetical protein CDN98_14910 [Roseateles terrae]
MSLTMEGVLALAPDESSAKAARGLTSPAKWPLLGADEAAVWGECQGSGSKPYQTQVDLSGPAFKCSCPSRKFPCKHGLALLLMRVQTAPSFTATEAPAWVAEWLASRHERAEKKEERDREAVKRAEERAARQEDGETADGAAGTEGTEGAADTAADAGAPSRQRQVQRWQRIEAAAQELQRWLNDQVARGFATLDAAAIKGWHTMAARMVDAQAPGLGQRLTAAAETWRQGPDWPERMLSRLGLLQLAVEAIGRRTSLPEAVQADLRTVCGWPVDQAEVLATATPWQDRLIVLGVITEERDGRLMERRVWLQGETSGRRVWLLEHAHGGRGFNGLWAPGTAVTASLADFPGAAPLRALVVERLDSADVLSLKPMSLTSSQLAAGSVVGSASRPAAGSAVSLEATVAARVVTTVPHRPSSSDAPMGDPWASEWHRVSERVASNPFVLLHPMVLSDALVLLSDEAGPLIAPAPRTASNAPTPPYALPAVLSADDRWLLLAASGGHPMTLAGEWDGERFRPLTAWSGDSPVPLWTRSAA